MKKLTKKTARNSRLLVLTALVAVGITACADAESREAPADDAMAGASEEARASTESSERTLVPQGTTMSFFVDQTISTDTHAIGDRFIATLDTPVRDADGTMILEAGTASQWVVTQASVQDGQSILAMELESIDWNGDWLPVAATVTAADIDADDPDSGSETAAKIGVGAAAGALVGQILGKDTESTLKGAGAGAAVGTAVALATKGGSAKLPAGSILVVRLDEALTIS